MALSEALRRPAAVVRTVDGRNGRTNLDRGPDVAAKGRGVYPPVSAEALRRVSGRLAVADDRVELRAGAL